MMMRLFFALLIGLISCPSGAKNDKKQLIIRVIQTAKDYAGLAPVLRIIKENRDIYKYIPQANPLKDQPYTISSRYGTRIHPINKTTSKHLGIDFASEYANRVYATAEGKVIFSGASRGYGKLVIIEHKYGFKTYYAHLTYIYCKTGDVVTTNHVIGFVGSTGVSTGNHLHYEVRKDDRAIDPAPFLGL